MLNGDAPGPWYLYLVRTREGALYTGISTDVARRLEEHRRGGRRGARFLRARAPLQLVYRAALGDRSVAQAAEYRVKRLPRRDKEGIVASQPSAEQLLQLLQSGRQRA